VLDGSAPGAPALHPIALDHRSDGQLARVDRPYGGSTTFSYDALGRLVAIAEQASPGAAPDPGARSVTTIERDALGRIAAVERANGMREEAEYDPAGRVSRRRALLRGAVENDVRFHYAAGRLVRVQASDGFDEQLAYDAAGRLSEVIHSGGEATRFAYDARSRVIRTDFVLPGGAPLASLTHAYDLADRELSLTLLGVDLVARRYLAGRLDVTTYGNGVRQHHYRSTQSGRELGRELWRGSRRIERSAVDREPAPGGALLGLRSSVDDGTSADGVTREDFHYATLYAQNAMERRVASAVADASGAPAEELRYDALSNFTGGTSPRMMRAVVYNAERNRVLSAERTPASGVSPSAGSRFAYDAAGFATAQSFEVASYTLGLDTFAWNARGQLATIHSDGALAASFAYDAVGRRSARTLGGVTQRWRFGGLVEADAAGVPVAIDLFEVRIDLAGQHRYRHSDLRGNPKHVTNAAGRVVRHTAYFAYGSAGSSGPLADAADFARGTAIATLRERYVLIGARLYAPALARFLAPDPVFNPVNAYAYAQGNPVDFWDPAGLHSGSHYDDTQALLNLGKAMLGVAGAVVAFGLVGGPVAVIGLGLAAFAVADALIELDQQRERHEAETLRERRGSPEPGGRTGSGVPEGGGSAGGALLDLLFDRPRGRVCSNDGSGDFCTSSATSGWVQSPRTRVL
jgi:RHS repeat-associated protein